MDQQLQFLSIAIGMIVFTVYLVFRKSRRLDVDLPPSPPSLPIAGHLHLIGKYAHQSLFVLARKYGGLMFLRLGRVGTLVVSSPDAAREVLKIHDIVFASRPVSTSSKYFGYDGVSMSWSPYGEQWRNLRKLCTLELLTSKRVEMFSEARKLEMSALLEEISESARKGSTVNLTDRLSDLTLNIMTRMVMNKSFSAGNCDRNVREQALYFRDKITEACAVASGINIGDFIPWLKWMDIQASKIKMYAQLLDDHIQKEVDEHRNRWEQNQDVKDFIDVMLSLSLDDTTVKALAMDMIVAGTDTAAVTVEWALAELINNPQLLKQAQEELEEVVGGGMAVTESDIPKLKFLQAVVKESLRLHPTAPLLLPHESTEACRIAKFVIPAKTRLIVNAYALGRDPSVWEDPCRFNPARFIDKSVDFRGQHFELLPFGSGRRICPGMLLGITMVHYMLASLLHEFHWRIPGQCGTVDMSEGVGMTLPRKYSLQLVPVARLCD